MLLQTLNKKCSYACLLSFYSFVCLYGQQEAQYSLYFFNPTLINPAYSASANGLKAIVIGRNQWVNFDGAPKTAALSLFGPVSNKNIGLGVNLNYDQLGATRTTSSFFNLSYQIKMKARRKGLFKGGGMYAIRKSGSSRKSRRRDFNYLSFGLNAGFDLYQTRFSQLRVENYTDPVYTEGYDYTQMLTNVGGGIYYYTKNYYIGLSIPRLSKNQLNSVGQLATQERHVYLYGGFVKEMENNVDFKPSFVVKTVNNAPPSIDFNLSFLFNERIWLGAMYRYKSATGINAMFIVNQNFKVGYAYDYTLNAIQRFTTGSHEVMLSYEFVSKKKIKVTSCAKF